MIEGFRQNLAAFPAKFCGHVLAGFVEPTRSEEFYTGEKAAHGIKHLAAFFPNGMVALAGPFLGTVETGG